MENATISLHDLEIHAEQAEVVTWEGRQALRLENGLALAPEVEVKDARIQVLIGTEGASYPGVVFRAADVLNFELAYAVPHVSGEWDALQYDPVFHGSNTWQLYTGPGYQHEADVPTGCWFQLKVDFYGHQAAVTVDGGAPLLVKQLAHSITAGRFGLWTFRPAYFSALRVSASESLTFPSVEVPSIPEDILSTWYLEDYGVVKCEPNGVVNLNRYLPTSIEKARLVRHFESSEVGDLSFDFGFSDVMMLELDGDVIYRGENTFKGFEDRAARGYVELGRKSVRCAVARGNHKLAAELEVREEFGWGLVLACRGKGLNWLPVELG